VPKKQPLSLYASQYGDSELGYSGLRTIVPEEVTYQSPASATPLYVTPYPGPPRQFDARWSKPDVSPYVPAQAPVAIPTLVRQVSASTFTDFPTTPLGRRVGVAYLPAVAVPYASPAAASSTVPQPSHEYLQAGSLWSDDFDEMGREGEREREKEEARGEWRHVGEWTHVAPAPPPPWLARPLPRFRSDVNVAAPDECEECARRAWLVGPHDR